MVRLGEKRSLLDASCCRREVMKGGGGFLRRSLRSTAATRRVACESSDTTSLAWPSCESTAFSPRTRATRAANGGGALPSTCASMVQYSSGRKALISASRSTTRRTATDCTRPADRPRRTLDHSTGLIS